MRPKVKYAVIYRHRNEYPVSVMCKFFNVSRSGYYDFAKRIGKPEHDVELAEKIKECQNRTDKTYGYRRVWKWLQRENIHRNPKTVALSWSLRACMSLFVIVTFHAPLP